jgi:hypothetical protein
VASAQEALAPVSSASSGTKGLRPSFDCTMCVNLIKSFLCVLV